MAGRVLVLDTNVARGGNLARLEALARRGLRLRISETAYLEWFVQCAAMLLENRLEARGIFFRRAKRLAPVLDEIPMAPSAGILVRKVIAEADGLPIPDAYRERERGLAEQWATICGTEITDEAWLEIAPGASAHLDLLDKELIRVARPEAELAKKVSEDTRAAYEQWAALPAAEQLPHMCRFVKETTRLSDAAAERLDAMVCTNALRLVAAAKGSRTPKRNDGADFSHPMHIGEGCILVTDEWQLVDIVDQSGTYQAPWVRRLDDLDDLPDGPSWGDSARRTAERFKRRDNR